MWHIQIQVPAKGIASISGLVESNDDMQRIHDIIKAVDGVVEVQSDLSVKPAALI